MCIMELKSSFHRAYVINETFLFFSVFSFLVHIDENGDAGGNYTILGVKKVSNDRTNHSSHGLFPIGTFITRTNQSDSFGRSSYPVCDILCNHINR